MATAAVAAAVTGDRYLDLLVRFVARHAGALIDGSVALRLHPVGLHYVAARLEALRELELVGAGAPVDYLRAYVADLGDHRALEQLRRILRLLPSLKVVSALPAPARDPAPLSLGPFARLRSLELRGCDLSTSAARGLLELRHTLEKLVCHNSTDALRHVFAGRIVDIKDSPVWSQLSYVSCACNGLVLMDESLQLLPAVETLDLNRNRFAKVDNLRKCTKLRHLDLGFNQLRSIALLSEVSSRIVKLVVRNNALTTLRGIENLKSLVGLDLSYNIISSFSELEILGSLSLLQNLWLEGNPICCARWYRAHVFSLVPNAEKLKLDDKGISTQEYWETHLIFASRQKQPAGYGFYFPAKDGPEDEGNLSLKRKKNSRLACILEEERRILCEEAGDQESSSHDSDSFKKEENAAAESDSKIVNLINRAELMKKERSVHWLREFKEWMDENSEDTEAETNIVESTFTEGNGIHKKQKKRQKSFEESSKNVSDLAQTSEGGSSSNNLESDLSFTDEACVSANGDLTECSNKMNVDHDHLRMHLNLLQKPPPVVELKNNSHSNSVSVEEGDTHLKTNGTPTNPTNEILEPSPSFASPSSTSPPHYREDILHRRLYLEEEFMQMSGELHSFGSMDSGSSCSDDSSGDLYSSSSEDECLATQTEMKLAIDGQMGSLPYVDHNHEEKNREEYITEDKEVSDYSSGEDNPSCTDAKEFVIHEPWYGAGHKTDQVGQGSSCLVGQKGEVKLKRRTIPLLENHNSTKLEFLKANGDIEVDEDVLTEGNGHPRYLLNHHTSCCGEVGLQNHNSSIAPTNSSKSSLINGNTVSCDTDKYEYIKDFFNLKIANNEESETCEKVACCECFFQDRSNYVQRKIALLRSCRSMFYVLSIDVAPDGQETVSKVLGSYKLEDLEKVLIGLGLQALRVYMAGNVTYLLLTRTMEEAKDVLSILNMSNFPQVTNAFSLQSWEQVQVQLLEKHICGSLNMGIFFYSMLLFLKDDDKEDSWATRSLFVIEESILVCVENFDQFGYLIDDSAPYFSLDSCCSIRNILELVIDHHDNRCLTMVLVNDMHDDGLLSRSTNMENDQTYEISTIQTWKLKWFSEETMLKFIPLLKAMYSGLAGSPLPVKCIS